MSGEALADLSGRHVVVTGAGTGIGRAIARRLSGDGASVTVLAGDGNRLEAAAASLREAAHVARCDIRTRKAVDNAFAGAAALLCPIHALVAAAGIGGPNDDGAGDRFDDLVGTIFSARITALAQRCAILPLAPWRATSS